MKPLVEIRISLYFLIWEPNQKANALKRESFFCSRLFGISVGNAPTGGGNSPDFIQIPCWAWICVQCPRGGCALNYSSSFFLVFPLFMIINCAKVSKFFYL